jgi:Fe-S-cluster-containing hydrogenase component 2
MKYLYVYPERCTGCRQCAVACSVRKFGDANPKKGAINILRDEFARYEIQFLCYQCDDPECAVVCVRDAIKKEENIVKLDKNKCIGCRLCVAACPYGGIFSFKGEIIKCDLCDGDPVCIKFCSTNAIIYEEETIELAERRRELAEKILKRG